jgi:hypothetical protein
MYSQTKLEPAVTGQSDMILVPRKPTQAMLKAAWADALGEDATGVWESMIEEWELSTESETR